MSADRSDLRAEQVEALGQVVYDVAVDHPMWVDADGKPLDYSATRESLLADFICDVQDALAPTVAALLADATAEAERQRDAVVAAVEAFAIPMYHSSADFGKAAALYPVQAVPLANLTAALAAARPAERERGGA